jgi:hypothetical protein
MYVKRREFRLIGTAAPNDVNVNISVTYNEFMK